MGSTSLNPAVSRAGYRRWLGHLSVYVVAVAFGAASTAFFLVIVATGVERIGGKIAWVSVAAAVIALAVARDLGARTPVPYRNVQVPQVLRYLLPPSLLALAYGTQLGTGFLTRYTYSTHTAAMLLLPLATNDPAVIAMTVAALALGKGLVVIASAGTTSDEGAEAIDVRLRWRPRGLQIMRTVNAGTAALLVLSSLSSGGVL
jgi:hypothetical protein